MYTVIFFFNDTATTEIYTLSLHDALPISMGSTAFTRNYTDHSNDTGYQFEFHCDKCGNGHRSAFQASALGVGAKIAKDRKSTRLNSSHANISYAVFCLKKKSTISLHNVII